MRVTAVRYCWKQRSQSWRLCQCNAGSDSPPWNCARCMSIIRFQTLREFSGSTMLIWLRCIKHIRHIKRVINACLQLSVSVKCIG